MKILVLNCGSSSLKFQLIESETSERLIKGNFERIGGMKSTLRINVRGNKEQIAHIARDFDEAIEFVLEVLLKPEYNLIKSLDEIQAVGHRIVHGGEMFSQSVLIDEKVIKEIEKCIDLAPLHNPAGVAGIRAAQKVLPNVPMVVVFDTAFHQTMPPKAYIYQIPYRYYTSYKIRKYGFHGTSHKYVSERVAELMGNPEHLKVVNCHLGQGASICAIEDGKSIDTSMGLTPLSGIPMATRSGDIDPAIIPYIMKKDNLQPEDVEEILNKQSGGKWPDYSRKLNYEKTEGTIPRDLEPFYINVGFKLEPNDISLFLNYEDVDCDEFIKKLYNVKLYTLFPMKSYSYAVNIYNEIPPNEYFSKSLEQNNLKCLILTTEERIPTITYNLCGLKDEKSPNIDYENINNKDLNITDVISKNYQYIIFDYDIGNFKEISKIKDFLMILDNQIDEIYKNCDQNSYNFYISSLYGLYKEYIVGVDKKVKLDYSKELPLVIINNNYPASKYTIKYGDTHDLSNTIFNSITNNPNIKTLFRKKGIIAFFKE